MTSVYNPLRLIAWPMGIEHGGIGAHCLLNESWPLVAPTPIPPQRPTLIQLVPPLWRCIVRMYVLFASQLYKTASGPS